MERLQSRGTARILDFASGSGRNTKALEGAGFTVVAIDDATAATEAPLHGVAGKFDAAVSTHGLLHGTAAQVASHLRGIAAHLGAQGLLYAAFGSTRDARFGRGERCDAWSFAPTDGDERGVVHAYFDRSGITGLLETDFAIESLEERSVDHVAGAWAHRARPLRGAVHWFAIGRKR